MPSCGHRFLTAGVYQRMNLDSVIREDVSPTTTVLTIYIVQYPLSRYVYLHAMQKVFMNGPLLNAPTGRHDGYCCGIR